MIHPSIHSSMSNHSRFFPFLANTFRLFPSRRLTIQCPSLDNLTINTSFPSSPFSFTVNPIIKFLTTFSSILPSILACPAITDVYHSLPILTNPYPSFLLSTQCSSFDTLTINTFPPPLQLPPP